MAVPGDTHSSDNFLRDRNGQMLDTGETSQAVEVVVPQAPTEISAEGGARNALDHNSTGQVVAQSQEQKANSTHRSSFSTDNSGKLSIQKRTQDPGNNLVHRGRGGSHAVDRMSRWVKNLRVKSRSSQVPPSIYEAEEDVLQTLGSGAIYGKSFETSPTMFTSSTGFVHRIRTATASVASLSYYTGGDAASRRVAKDRQSRQGSPSRSHRGSWDMATVRRAGERRKIMQEIISTEETYITDIKTLKAVYDRVVESPELDNVEPKASIKANISDLIELHERLLSSILNSFPSSTASYDIKDDKTSYVGAVDILGLASGDGLAEPEAVMNLCEIFGEMLQKVFIYEEYAVHYNEMLTGFVGDYKTCDNWKNWESGFEMLANSIHSSNAKNNIPGKKAVGLADLIVKPIQRICRYQLLFEEMLKYSPVIDCPESNFHLQQICKSCKDTASTVDAIMNNDQNSKDLLRKTWTVRNLLILERERHLFEGIWPDLDTDFYRKLGRLNLCSILFVAWPSDETIKGSYMACLLYKTYLMLANVIELQKYPSKLQFAIEFLIPLQNAQVYDAINEDGIQCPNAPYSWKLQFEFNSYTHQVLLCARNMTEESEWRSQLKLAMEKVPESTIRTDLHQNSFHGGIYSLGSRSSSLSVTPLGLRHLAGDRETSLGSPFSQARHSPKSNFARSSIQHCVIYIYNTDDASEARRPGIPPAEFAVASPCDLSLDAIANLKSKDKDNGLVSDEHDALIYTLSPAREHRTKVDNLLASVWARNSLKTDTLTRIKRLPSKSLQRTLTVVSGKSSSTDSGSTDGGSGLRKLSINSLSLRWGSRRKTNARTPTPVSQEADLEQITTHRSVSVHRGDTVQLKSGHGRSSSYHFESSPSPSKEPQLGHRRVTSFTQPTYVTRGMPARMENDVPNPQSPYRRRKSLLTKLSLEPLQSSKQTKAECWSVGLSKDIDSSNCSQPSLEKHEVPTNFSTPRTPSRAKDSLKRLLLGI